MQTNANTSVESQDIKTWNAWASRANNAYIAFLAATLIVTVLIVVFNNRLNKAKDGAYAREKQASDERIAAAKADAAKADERAGLANEAAGKANETAGKANERAGKLEGQNIQLRTDLETATAESRAKQAELAREQGKLAIEQRRTADAQRQAAEAQRALAEIVERRTASRHLKPEERARLVEALRQSPLKGMVIIDCVQGDSEGLAFAKEINAALKEAGWPTNDVQQSSFDNNPVGIGLRVLSASKAPAYAEFLQRAFNDIGPRFDFTEEHPQTAEGTVELIVGIKRKE